jgi:hypothetical protein
VIAALDASGQSVAVFAAREGFDPQRLYFWRRRLESGAADVVQPPAFIEVRSPAEHGRIEVVLRSGRVVRVAESIDGDLLRRLVDALEQDPPC